ncbi:MAG: CPBP family intramembrane metalloprotease [Holophagales bacterium]|nr:CPBP family intramembrane metalloprotease [Holophagales bacterium]
MTENGRRLLTGDGIKILGFFVFCTLAVVLADFLPFQKPITIWLRPLFVLAVSWFCLRAENQGLSNIGIRIGAKFFRDLLLGALLGMAIILTSAFAIVLFGGIAFERADGAGLGTLFFPLVPFLAVGIFEELLFRGYAFQRTVARLGRTFALLLFALLFVAAHLGNPGMEGAAMVWPCINIGIASVLLGLAWIRTNSLALPIGIHVGWNWSQGGLLGFGVSGAKSAGFFEPMYSEAPQWMTGGVFGLEAAMPTAVVALVACALFAARWPGKKGAC